MDSALDRCSKMCLLPPLPKDPVCGESTELYKVKSFRYFNTNRNCLTQTLGYARGLSVNYVTSVFTKFTAMHGRQLTWEQNNISQCARLPSWRIWVKVIEYLNQISV